MKRNFLFPFRLSFILTPLFFLSIGATKADPFFSETFEEYTVGQPLLGVGGQGLDKWAQWPTDATVSALIVDKGHQSEKSLEIKNDDKGPNTFYLSSSRGPGAWLTPAENSNKVWLRFNIFIPSGAQSQGGKVTFGCQQVNGASPIVGATVSLSDSGNGSLVLAAINGVPDTGKPMDVSVGSCAYDEWIQIQVELDFSAKVYSVMSPGMTSQNGLVFPMAKAWSGDTWGDNAQLAFGIPKGATVLVDDIQCSTEEFK